jgi:hypothetical protein
MRLFEALKLVHYPDVPYPKSTEMTPTNPKHQGKKGIIVVKSDKPNDYEANNEVFGATKGSKWKPGKGLIKKWTSGGVFDYDPDISIWYTSEDDFEKAKDVIVKANGNMRQAEYMMNSLIELDKVLGQIENVDFLRAKIDTFMEDLSNIESDEEFNSAMNKYMDFIAKLINYSDQNSILIKKQKPDATQVASFTGWLENGRVPLGTNVPKKAGQGLIKIIRPIWIWGDINPSGQWQGTKKKAMADPTNDNKYPQGWEIQWVYDISDTREATLDDYKDNPRHKLKWRSSKLINGQIPTMGSTDAVENPSEMDWWDQTVDDQDKSDKLYGLLRAVADDIGVDTTRTNLTQASGHINVQTSRLSNRVATIIHNMVHTMLHEEGGAHHTKKIDNLNANRKELQAEMVTYLVMKSFRMNVKHHPAAAREYKRNPNIISDDMGVVTAVATDIVKQLKGKQRSLGRGATNEVMNASIDEALRMAIEEMANI